MVRYGPWENCLIQGGRYRQPNNAEFSENTYPVSRFLAIFGACTWQCARVTSCTFQPNLISRDLTGKIHIDQGKHYFESQINFPGAVHRYGFWFEHKRNNYKSWKLVKVLSSFIIYQKNLRRYQSLLRYLPLIDQTIMSRVMDDLK